MPPDHGDFLAVALNLFFLIRHLVLRDWMQQNPAAALDDSSRRGAGTYPSPLRSQPSPRPTPTLGSFLRACPPMYTRRLTCR